MDSVSETPPLEPHRSKGALLLFAGKRPYIIGDAGLNKKIIMMKVCPYSGIHVRTAFFKAVNVTCLIQGRLKPPCANACHDICV
jgi:hypothetical protein